MDREELLTRLRNRSKAFKGTASDSADEFIDSALDEYSLYNPKIIHSLNNPANETGIYDPPENFIDILGVKDSERNIEIDFQVIEDEDGEVKLHLGQRQSPSWQHLDEQEYYQSPTLLSYSIFGSSYELYNVRYTIPPTIEILNKEGIRDVSLYAEYLAYQDKSSDVQKFIDITDSDPSGESTTVSYSGQAKLYGELAQQKLDQFNKNVEKPVGMRDTNSSEYRPRYSIRTY